MSGPSERERIDGLFELAFRRHQAGQLREAEELYRSILAADPRQLDALYYCGMIALQEGRPDAARELIGQAVAANDAIAIYHAGLAETHRALGQRAEAIAHFRKAVTLEPGHWAAHSELADLLRDEGDFKAAAEHYASAVGLKPDLASAQHNLAAVLLDQGRANEAVEAAARTLALRDDADSRALFVQCVREARRLPAAPAFRRLLIRALREAWTRPITLAGPANALIKSDPIIANAARSAFASWPQRLTPPACGPALGALAGDELTHVVLDTALINDPELERLLTSIRAILLDTTAHATGELPREITGFAFALARECFRNEYVFHVSDAERQVLSRLRSSAATALSGSARVPEFHLIMLAAYAPLSALERDEALLGRNWSPLLTTLVTEQVREPKAEAGLRETMPRLTTIADPVSRQVREQYEDNPYPRWTEVAPTAPEAGVHAYLRALFPRAPLREAAEPDTLEILVAGCGTGQQPIGTAQRFPRARVLAVDLSLASLAYAKRKTAAAGVRIDYGQADILELDPGRRFDIVESTGVLHHLADPMRGWSRLVEMVKPGGFMRIGLYSEIARRDIVTLSGLISARGYRETAEDIRRCRQEIISQNDPRFTSIVYSPDFCSVSGCRDLLFHVQEHRLTLPQIDAFLTANRLTLLGFELPGSVLRRYRAAYPDDAAMTDLACWDRFEAANPDTFDNMYPFWLQKAG